MNRLTSACVHLVESRAHTQTDCSSRQTADKGTSCLRPLIRKQRLRNFSVNIEGGITTSVMCSYEGVSCLWPETTKVKPHPGHYFIGPHSKHRSKSYCTFLS